MAFQVKHPFKFSLFFGVPMIILALVLQFVNPSFENNLAPGFHTPVLGMEFIESEAEVAAFFDVENPNTYRADLIWGNMIDYLFMFFYSAFLMLTAYGIAKETGERAVKVAIVLSALVFCSDVLENLTIGAIVDTYFNGGTLGASYFGNLHFFTWLKWGGIATVLLIFSGYFLKKGVFSKIIGGLSVVTFPLSIAAYFHRSVLNEMMALCIALLFALLFIHHIIFKVEVQPAQAG